MKSTLLKKFIALFVVTAFLFSSLTPNISAAIISAASQTADNTFDTAIFFSVIPLSQGKITSVNNKQSDTVVINIQDLHSHAETQRNISKIIDSISSKYNVSVIYTEGGYGKIDVSWINAVKDDELKNKIIEQLLNNGELTASEYYAMTCANPKPVKGIENKQIHIKNIKRLADIENSKSKYEEIIGKMNKEIGILNKLYTNGRNIRFNKALAKYENKQISDSKFYSILEKYVSSINKNPSKYNNTTRISIDSYPNVNLYLGMIKESKKTDAKRASLELQALIENLKNTIPYSQYKQLLDDTNNFQDNEKVLEFVFALLKANSVAAPKYGNLNKLAAINEYTKLLNPVDLLNEQRNLTEKIKFALSYNNTEAEIAFITDFKKYFKDYLTASITYDDWSYVKENLNLFLSIYAKYSAFNNLKEIESDFAELNKYYDINTERNEIFLSNIFDKSFIPSRLEVNDKADDISPDNILKNAKDVKIVITGGYHSEGLKELLSQKGITSIVITPNITTDISKAQATYTELIKEQAQFQSEALAKILMSNISDINQTVKILRAAYALGLDGAQILDKIKADLENISAESELIDKIKIRLKNISIEGDDIVIIDNNNKITAPLSGVKKIDLKNIEEAITSIPGLSLDKIGNLFNLQRLQTPLATLNNIEYEVLKQISLLLFNAGIYFAEGPIAKIEATGYLGERLDEISPDRYVYFMPFMQNLLLRAQMKKDITVHIAESDDDWNAAFEIFNNELASNKWSQETIRQSQSYSKRIGDLVIVAKVKGSAASAALIHSDMHIAAFATASDFKGVGLGTLIINRIKELAAEIGLNKITLYSKTKHSYEENGFKPVPYNTNDMMEYNVDLSAFEDVINRWVEAGHPANDLDSYSRSFRVNNPSDEETNNIVNRLTSKYPDLDITVFHEHNYADIRVSLKESSGRPLSINGRVRKFLGWVFYKPATDKNGQPDKLKRTKGQKFYDENLAPVFEMFKIAAVASGKQTRDWFLGFHPEYNEALDIVLSYDTWEGNLSEAFLAKAQPEQYKELIEERETVYGFEKGLADIISAAQKNAFYKGPIKFIANLALAIASVKPHRQHNIEHPETAMSAGKYQKDGNVKTVPAASKSTPYDGQDTVQFIREKLEELDKDPKNNHATRSQYLENVRANIDLSQEQLEGLYKIASHHHRGQTREDLHTPYMAHILGSVAILIKMGITKPELIAAEFLHDAMEDSADYESVMENGRIKDVKTAEKSRDAVRENIKDGLYKAGFDKEQVDEIISYVTAMTKKSPYDLAMPKQQSKFNPYRYYYGLITKNLVEPKLADRANNIGYLKARPPASMVKYLFETMKEFLHVQYGKPEKAASFLNALKGNDPAKEIFMTAFLEAITDNIEYTFLPFIKLCLGFFSTISGEAADTAYVVYATSEDLKTPGFIEKYSSIPETIFVVNDSIEGDYIGKAGDTPLRMRTIPILNSKGENVKVKVFSANKVEYYKITQALQGNRNLEKISSFVVIDKDNDNKQNISFEGDIIKVGIDLIEDLKGKEFEDYIASLSRIQKKLRNAQADKNILDIANLNANDKAVKDVLNALSKQTDYQNVKIMLNSDQLDNLIQQLEPGKKSQRTLRDLRLLGIEIFLAVDSIDNPAKSGYTNIGISGILVGKTTFMDLNTGKEIQARLFLTKEDLKNYNGKLDRALSDNYQGYNIIGLDLIKNEINNTRSILQNNNILAVALGWFGKTFKLSEVPEQDAVNMAQQLEFGKELNINGDLTKEAAENIIKNLPEAQIMLGQLDTDEKKKSYTQALTSKILVLNMIERKIVELKLEKGKKMIIEQDAGMQNTLTALIQKGVNKIENFNAADYLQTIQVEFDADLKFGEIISHALKDDAAPKQIEQAIAVVVNDTFTLAPVFETISGKETAKKEHQKMAGLKAMLTAA